MNVMNEKIEGDRSLCFEEHRLRPLESVLASAKGYVALVTASIEGREPMIADKRHFLRLVASPNDFRPALTKSPCMNTFFMGSSSSRRLSSWGLLGGTLPGGDSVRFWESESGC
jgi:hypothetical protein